MREGVREEGRKGGTEEREGGREGGGEGRKRGREGGWGGRESEVYKGGQEPLVNVKCAGINNTYVYYHHFMCISMYM